MRKSRFSEEQILGVLKEAEAGGKVREVCRGRFKVPRFKVLRFKVPALQGAALQGAWVFP